MVKKAKKSGGLRSLRSPRPVDDHVFPPDDAKVAPSRAGAERVFRRPPGRPPGIVVGDPADFRTERFGMRLHPHLKEEIEILARKEGFRMAQWIERALVDSVNRARGRDVVDRIGRRFSDRDRDRGHE